VPVIRQARQSTKQSPRSCVVKVVNGFGKTFFLKICLSKSSAETETGTTTSVAERQATSKTPSKILNFNFSITLLISVKAETSDILEKHYELQIKSDNPHARVHPCKGI